MKERTDYPYKFVSHEVPPKPDNEMTRLLERCQQGETLSREERDRIADILWGTFGAHRPAYRLMGWEWPMWGSLRRILVKFTYEDSTFRVYYAPDKTALRKCLSQVREMVYA